MVDAQMRQVFDAVPVPTYETVAFTSAPPLTEATVAIVTTAGLHLPDQPGWGADHGDQSFRVLPSDRRDVKFSHVSHNFDRSGISSDLNVAYPADRLREFADRGEIGAVAANHLSFMGAQDETMSTIRMDSGPAAAKQLIEDGVDVVLLVPI